MKRLITFVVFGIWVLCLFFGFVPFQKPVVVSATQTKEAIQVTLISYFDPQNIIQTTITSKQYGDSFAFASSLAEAPSGEVSYQFLYWIWNGKLEIRPIHHSFDLTKSNTLQAVFSPSNYHVVTFVDPNGEVLKIEYVTPGGNATALSSIPTKIGYTFSQYSTSLSNITQDTFVYLQYQESQPSSYTLSVKNGTGGGTNFTYNQVATITAPATQGELVFSHWTIDGKVVSYQNPYSFTILQNTAVEARYASSHLGNQLRIFVSDNLRYRESEFRHTYRGQLEVPSGFTVVEYGLLTHPFERSILTLDTEGVYRIPSRRRTTDTHEFLVSLDTPKAQSVRGYLIARDTQGALHTVYSESVYYIENGSFETGDLSGWTSYQLWKDESALSAFRQERIVSSANYGSTSSNPYDKVGQYLFGVYVHPYDNSNKDLNQERMGMLRSRSFMVAGSGMISFRLGGGRNPATAYVSVVDASTHQELARYANRHFANNTIASAQFGGSITNSEAFLFQYYADLSAHIGKEVYLLFVDAASHEWNVLAIDDVITYYPVSFSVSANQTALNILPVIPGAGSATNAIPNGTLSANLNQWENPQGVFQIGNGGAISSVGGNGAVGALRSSAFHINGANKILQFDFAGAIRYDKQVFVLVKEVGSNREVMRLVRRDDQSSRSPGGDFVSHWFDLSSLSTSKEYYLEVIDNRDGEWGVALIRNVSLIATPDEARRVAVNAFYGLRSVHSISGDHRTIQTQIESNPSEQAFWVTATPGESAATTFHINYHSQTAVTKMEYTLASDPYFKQSTTVSPASESFSTTRVESGGVWYGFTARTINNLSLTNLTPNQTYLYRIYSGSHVSSVYSFKTAPVVDSFQFLYFTDTQSIQASHASIIDSVLSRAQQDYPNIAFGLISGDLVERGSASMHWDYFFEARSLRFPLMAVPGNHDYYTDSESLQSALYFNKLFSNPKNGISERLNSSYYIQYSNTLFIHLDIARNEYTTEQIAWLQQVVNQYRLDFVIVSMHYSAYGTTHTTTAMQMRETWSPVFEALDIDLVLSGHDHVYARTPRLKGGVSTSNVNEGTVYLIGGSASHKLYNTVPSNQTTFAYYQNPTVSTASVISVSGEAILIQTINASGQILDSFTILKKNLTP